MSSNWTLSDSQFNPQQLRFKETLFTIGNGMFCTRGAFEESYPGDNPATLAHGLFDDVPTYRTELVNLPNWLSLQVFVDGEPFRLDRGEVLAYERRLNLFNGCLARRVLWRSHGGHTLELHWERFISLADRHTMGIRLQVRSLDFNGPVDIFGSLDGLVDNAGVKHWDCLSQGGLGQTGGYMHLRTKTTMLEICQAFTLRVDPNALPSIEQDNEPCTPSVRMKMSLISGQTLVVEKLVCLFTSQDNEKEGTGQLTEDAVSVDLTVKAAEKLKVLEQLGYANLCQESAATWAKEWDDCTVTIEGDPAAELAVRFSLFQLLIAAPRHTTQCSIPSRTLSGFRYHGHVFWEAEIYMLPFFLYTRPELARNMLLYRYHTLPRARLNASEKGMAGSRFAWESATSGEEITPRWVPGTNRLELERIWSGDLEQFVTATIAFAVHQYWQVTSDDAFLRDYGAEIILNAACFWEGRVEWNTSAKRFEINDVFGPDEFHLHVNNNAFTNELVRCNMRIAGQVWDWLCQHAPDKAAALEIELGLTPARLQKWQHILSNIPLTVDPETDLIEQFDGFFRLREINLENCEPRLQSMGVILGPENQQTQVIRQPDVLMLLYLFKNLVDLPVQRSNWEYYTPRTDLSHGSSLGSSIQAALAARLGEVTQAYTDFMAASAIDLEDTFGNTEDGIHAGNAGGIWQAVVFGFAGLEISNIDGVNSYSLHPRIPSHWKRLSFSFYLSDKRYAVDLINPIVAGIPQTKVPGAKTTPTGLSAQNIFNPSLTTENQINSNSFIDSLPGMVYRCLPDHQRTMLLVDRFCFNLTGFHPVDLIQNRVISYIDLIHPHDREYVCNEIRIALREKRSFWLAYRLVTSSKGEQWVWEYGRSLPLEEDGQRILEGRVIELAGRNPKYDALFEYAERLESLREIDQAILAPQSFTDVLHTALRTLKRILPDTDFFLLLLDLQLEQAEMFNLASGGQEIGCKVLQFTPEWRQRWFTPDNAFGNEMSDAKGAGVLEWMETQVIEVFGELGPIHRLIPLRSRGELVGILALRSENPDTFAQSRFGIVGEVANSLAIVFIQRRLLEQVRSANQSLQNLSRYLVNIQEQERRSLAYELHDEIGQALTAVKINLESLAILPIPARQPRLQESIQVVSQTLQQVRDISLNLRPALLDELGLPATLRWYVDRLAQWNNIDAQFQASQIQERMPPEIEITLFRVAQEALTNVIRHSKSNRVVVILALTGDQIILQVRDNGCGFIVEEAFQNAARGTSLGLLSMQERLHLVGGKLTIHSTLGLGTEIVAKIPLTDLLTQDEVEDEYASGS